MSNVLNVVSTFFLFSPGPPRSMNDILKSKQQIHEGPLQMQFFEPDSVF